MGPRLRDVALVAHILSSVGWFGAVVAFLALAVAGLTTGDTQLARGIYLAMDALAWLVIVPACFASLVTGIVQSLGTKWGLFRHYWVVIKLALTVLATAFLLLHTRPIDEIARVAASMPLQFDDHRALRAQLVVDSSAALVVLIVATTLAVVKPRGMTRYGRRKERAAAAV